MSRQSIDKIAANPKPTGRDGIWIAIRKLCEFSVTDLTKETDINRKTVSDYVKALVAADYLLVVSQDEGPDRYILVNNSGVRTPRVRADGSTVKQGAVNQVIWNTMRRSSGFSAAELRVEAMTEHVSISEATVKTYISHLLKAGYLKVLKKAVVGKSVARYRLIRNTGPKPPQIQSVKQVWDANLHRVTYYPVSRK